MISTSTSFQTPNARELSVSEIDIVSGASSPAGFLSKVVQILLMVPGEDYQLEGCTDDLRVCQWQGK